MSLQHDSEGGRWHTGCAGAGVRRTLAHRLSWGRGEEDRKNTLGTLVSIIKGSCTGARDRAAVTIVRTYIQMFMVKGKPGKTPGASEEEGQRGNGVTTMVPFRCPAARKTLIPSGTA